jgi:hypothetical protein
VKGETKRQLPQDSIEAVFEVPIMKAKPMITGIEINQ